LHQQHECKCTCIDEASAIGFARTEARQRHVTPRQAAPGRAADAVQRGNGGSGGALDAGTAVRAAFITIDSKA